MAYRMLALLVALFCISLVGDAQAQTYPCPSGGPGPGEQMVGMSQPGPGSAPIPLCSGGGQAPASESNSYASIALHPDAADIWVDGNYSGAGTSEHVALEMCTKAMGEGCWSTGEWYNSSMAILRDAGGRFFSAWLGDHGATRKKVLAECSATTLAEGGSVRKVYAAAV